MEPTTRLLWASGWDVQVVFWRAELSQIYPLLQKMEQDGLLSSHSDESEIGPTRRVYTRSAKGRDELQKWLLEGPTVGTEKLGYLAQVFFLANLDNRYTR